jgi:F-type H+-transporting ATPase subunit delta
LIRTIAKRYAKALVELAERNKTVDKTKDDLSAFADAVEVSKDLQKFFASPVMTPENKKAVIGDLAVRLGMERTTRRFLEHLAEAGRIRHVGEMREAFLGILAERRNRAVARLTTAVPLGGGDLENIRKKLEALTGRQVDIETAIDASLIGGVRAQIGSVIYDGTIKNRLAKMRKTLAN